MKEQCAVSDILENNGITVLDVNDEEIDEEEFDLLYDASIFTDDFEESDDVQIKLLMSYRLK